VRNAQRRIAGEAWAFRARVETEAALRFSRLASAIAAFDPLSPVPALMQGAARDEEKHAAICAGLAAGYGEAPAAGRDGPIAPRALDARAAVLYEVVAACCITETESVTTLTTLLAQDAEPPVRAALREIARDEVRHGRMGWAHLAREAATTDVSFLASLIPAMLSGTVDASLFAPADPELESADLLRHGLLPHSTRRTVFTGTLDDVVFPGLANFGVDVRPARDWLASMKGADAR